MSTNLFNPADKRSYPSRWPMRRGKQLFRVIDERSEDGSEELLSVSHITGITPRSQKNVTMFKAESLVGYKLCQVGDIAANTMWTWQGAIGVSRYAGVVSPAYNVYRQNGDIYNPRFLDMLLRERRLVDIYHSLSTGVRASRLRLYPDVFLTINFPVPPRAEQDQIVRFLDWKVSGINKMISSYRKQIGLLEELKQRMIDAAIETLAIDMSILRRIKTIAKCNRLTLDESTNPDYKFRYVDIGSVDSKSGITRYEEMTFSKAPSRARRMVVKDDIIVSTVRTYLRAITRIVDDRDVIVSTGFAVISPIGVDSKYLEYCFKSDQFCDEVMRRSIGIAYPAINASVLMDIAIPVPDHKTQIEIGESLDRECVKLNKAIETKKAMIAVLTELKAKIVSDIITGKFDVRSVEIPEYEFVDETADDDVEERDDSGDNEDQED